MQCNTQCFRMMPLKIRRYLLALAAFLLLSFVPTVAEVVDSMSNCDEFLLEKTPPQVPGILEGGNIEDKSRYKLICQTFKNERRFLTLYDTQNKIPVFSAYKYRGEQDKGRPTTDWKIEPQLEGGKGDKNMMKPKKTEPNYQAWDNDYRNHANEKNLNRGHLFPSSHALTEEDKESTFTLTNIVPQAITFNSGSWNKMEQCVKCVMDKYCFNNNGKIEGFVVTGAQPSTEDILNKRINIPSMLWSAFCCYSKNMSKWIASAHWGDNVPDDAKDKHLQTKTLAELNKKMTDKTKFNVFHANCPLDSHLESYPSECNCKK